MTNWLEFFDENLDGLVAVQKQVPQAWKREHRRLVKEGRAIRDSVDEGTASSAQVSKWFRETEGFARELEAANARARRSGPPARSYGEYANTVDDMNQALATTALSLAALVAARFYTRS